jgi:hypothetical protein
VSSAKKDRSDHDHEVKEIPQAGICPGANTPSRPCCPVCGGSLFEIRGKLQCKVCHTICETCCEGGRG